MWKESLDFESEGREERKDKTIPFFARFAFFCSKNCANLSEEQ